MYEYNATVDRVLDGDTVDCMVDLGFDIWVKQRVRLEGIDAPEVRTLDLTEKKQGFVVKDRVIELLENQDNKFILISHSVGKYGRCIGSLILESGESVQDILLKENLVKIYE